jgi:prepilin-type processing-associated H-X9-DG protein
LPPCRRHCVRFVHRSDRVHGQADAFEQLWCHRLRPASRPWDGIIFFFPLPHSGATIVKANGNDQCRTIQGEWQPERREARSRNAERSFHEGPFPSIPTSAICEKPLPHDAAKSPSRMRLHCVSLETEIHFPVNQDREVVKELAVMRIAMLSCSIPRLIRLGATLIELITVIAILTILAGIILPAIQMVRSTARSNTCRNNLHNIGIGVQNFISARKHLPNSRPMENLAPYLELPQFSNISSLDQLSIVSTLPSPPVVLCPEDTAPDSYRQYINYFLNDGSSIFPRNGIYSHQNEIGISLSEVQDGLSNTTLFGERIVRYLLRPEPMISDDAARRTPFRFSWLSEIAFEPGREQQFSDHTRSPLVRNAARVSGTFGSDDFFGTALFDHIAPPNNWTFRNGTGIDGSFRPLAPASSRHTGGVHVLYCDGSVHFTDSTIDEIVWRRLGSRNGGDR